MTDELPVDATIQRLVDTYPNLFRGKPPRVFSFLPDGWYTLADSLCADIETELGVESSSPFEVRQIKSKFGGLRFYFRFGRFEELHVDFQTISGERQSVALARSDSAGMTEERLRRLVSAACAASESICEVCGAAARTRNIGGWYATLCDVHAREQAAGGQSGV